MRLISIHVSERAYEEFRILSARSGRPVSELVRQAMADYLENDTTGGSLIDIPPHGSGRLLKNWTRSEILDEMTRR